VGPPGPKWLRRLIGNDFFQDVEVVLFYPSTRRVEQDFVKSARSADGLRKVHKIFLYGCTENTRNELITALPDCEVKLVLVD
jgi:hypothetical protein